MLLPGALLTWLHFTYPFKFALHNCNGHRAGRGLLTAKRQKTNFNAVQSAKIELIGVFLMTNRPFLA